MRIYARNLGVVLDRQAERPLLEGSHEPLPECVTKLAGYGVHYSHGEHTPELPRPHFSLREALHWQAKPCEWPPSPDLWDLDAALISDSLPLCH